MNRNAILQDHVRRGKTFYPPLLAPDSPVPIQEVEWRSLLLPEVFWLCLMVKCHGYDNARRLACALTCAAGKISNWATFPHLGAMSSFSALTPQQRYLTIASLEKQGVLKDLRVALDCLFRLYPACPLRFLLGDEHLSVRKREAIDHVAPVLLESLFRGEILPTLAQGLYFDVLMASGRMQFARGLQIHDTRLLQEYPDTEASQSTAAFVRCHVNQIGAIRVPTDWPKYFWKRGLKLGACQPPPLDGIYPNMLTQEFILYSVECFRHFVKEADEVWNSILRKYDFDLHWPLRDEVLLGLASRIYRLTVQIISFPPNWSEDIGEVFLRMAVESFIYFEWFRKKGKKEDFESFYKYGLGQQKLYMEHVGNYLKKLGMTEQQVREQNPGVDFLGRHKIPEFVPVNVGNPLGKNFREIAEEADCKELYSIVFGPTSSVVHGMYDTLERYYLCRCSNPFHRLHQIPYYWYKNPISFHGFANCLTLTDSILSTLLDIVESPRLDKMPGKNLMERILDEKALAEFAKDKEVSKEARSRKAFIDKGTIKMGNRVARNKIRGVGKGNG